MGLRNSSWIQLKDEKHYKAFSEMVNVLDVFSKIIEPQKMFRAWVSYQRKTSAASAVSELEKSLHAKAYGRAGRPTSSWSNRKLAVCWEEWRPPDRPKSPKLLLILVVFHFALPGGHVS